MVFSNSLDSKQQKILMQRYKDFQRHIPIRLPVEPVVPDILDSWENLHLSFTLSRGVRWRTDRVMTAFISLSFKIRIQIGALPIISNKSYNDLTSLDPL